ncbi:putative signaling protein [Rhodococcus sp. B50]|nr:putative signaling protein [Rhodococcus sp. B50]
MHHFDMGLWVLLLAYGTSVAGSFIGLSCAHRVAERPPGPARWGWLLMAALSIGGVGIWMTHFIAMMGLAVPGTLIRYDPTLTALSAIVAVAATAFGLRLIDLRVLAGRPILGTAALLVGSAVMGLTVSVMHYSGMAAIRIRGELSYDPIFVAASVGIGIGASIAALWLARVAVGRSTRVLGALVMGCAVAALHYTGMAGVHVSLDPAAPAPDGVTIMSLMLPSYVLGTIVLAVPLVALLLTPRTAEPGLDEAIAKWTSESSGTEPVPEEHERVTTTRARLATGGRRITPRRYPAHHNVR